MKIVGRPSMLQPRTARTIADEEGATT